MACQNDQVRVVAIGFGAAAGSVAERVGFTNVGGQTCTLSGYPGVTALNAQGVQVTQAVRDLQGMLGGLQSGSTTLPVVSLTPGQTASADVEGTDIAPGSGTKCDDFPTLLVTPPNLTQSTSITNVGFQGPGSNVEGFPDCGGLSINPLVPGTLGRDT